jgi:hypothetical protein
MGGSGCSVFFEARERLDLFKVLPPPVSRDHVYSAVPTSSVDLCERFLKPVAGPILPLSISKCKRAKPLKP